MTSLIALDPTPPPPVGDDDPSGGRRPVPVLKLFALGLAAALALLIAYPLLRILIGLFWVDGAFSLEAIRQTFEMEHLGDTLRDTFIVVFASVSLALVIGSSFAWLNERTDARMGVLTDVLPIVNFLIPGIATAVGWLLLLSDQAGYVNVAIRAVLSRVGIVLETGPFSASSWYAVIGVYTLTLVPFVYLVVSAGLRNMDSRLEEQSRMCGASVLTTLVRVTLPALRPSLFSSAFLAIWFAFAIFSVPVVLAEPAGIRMLSVQIVHALTLGYPPRTGVAITLSSMIMVSLGVVWFLQQRALYSGRNATMGGKGAGVGRVELGRLRTPARAVMLLYLVSAVLLPVAALTVVTLNGYWGTVSLGNLGLDSFWAVLSEPRNAEAIRNSLLLGVSTATITMVVASLIAWLAVSADGRLARVVSGISKVPAAIPPVVVAVGIVLAFGGPPFYLGGTVVILLLGFLVIAIPEGSITAESAIGQIGGELGQASALSGGSPARTFRSVYLPLMLPGLVAGWTLVFVRVMADVEASALLASTGTPVIGFQLLGLFEGGGGYSDLAALALFVSLVSMVLVTIVLSTTAAMHKRRRL